MKKAVFAILLSTAAIVAGPVACSKGDKADASYTVGTELGISKAAMDTSVKPGDDFYAYANGNWQKTTAIPADRSSIGAFYIAFLETEKRTRELVDAIVKSGGEPDTDDGRIAAFYNAYMNTKAIDAAGMKPVQADLARFDAITDKTSRPPAKSSPMCCRAVWVCPSANIISLPIRRWRRSVRSIRLISPSC
jgi:putative endopeptidase